MKLFRSLRPFLAPYRRVLLIGFLWLAAANLLGLTIPWMLKRGVEAVQGELWNELAFFCAFLAGAALLRCGTRILSRLRFLHTARRVEIDLQKDLLDRLLHQNGPFFDRHRTGDLLARFTSDLTNVRMLAGFGILTILNAALVYVLTLGPLLILSPALTLIALTPYPLMLLLVKRLSRALLHVSSQVQAGAGRIGEAVEEGVSGQAVIRSHGMAGVRTQAFDAVNAEFLRLNLVLARLRALAMPIMTLIGPIGTLLVLYFGGQRVGAGDLSLGDLVAFNAYLMQLAFPTLMLGWVLTLLQRAAASMERLEEIPPRPAEPHASPPIGTASAPDLHIRGLSFAYEHKPVLQGIDLKVPAGTLLGLTGSTGSGKSTLLRLLSGLYPLPAQTVLVGGDDLCALRKKDHLQRLAVVPQEGRLFSGTLRENLLYAAPRSDEELMREAAEKVCFLEEAERFPDGFDTRVGEGGMTLSGGQRQRVSLGRALARGGSLWLLDDPFSHLDAATARTVWENLLPHFRGRTVVIASGRASLLAAADRVAVLDGGRIAEAGDPRELLGSGGAFARLVEQERLREELEALP